MPKSLFDTFPAGVSEAVAEASRHSNPSSTLQFLCELRAQGYEIVLNRDVQELARYRGADSVGPHNR